MSIERARRVGQWWATPLGIVCIALGILCYDANAVFEGSASVSNAVSTGSVGVTLAGTGDLNQFDITASNMLPGAITLRALTLVPHGSVGTVDLSTTATTSSALDTDTTNGLQLVVVRCSQPWTDHMISGVPVHDVANIGNDCPGGVSFVVFDQQDAFVAAIGTYPNLGSLDLAPETPNYLLVGLHLPDAADDSFQGLTSVIRFTFNAHAAPTVDVG